VPNKPKTPVRSVRVEDEIWETAKVLAKAEGRNMSEVVRELLAEWIDPDK
jgi:predicted DNA-binding protein